MGERRAVIVLPAGTAADRGAWLAACGAHCAACRHVIVGVAVDGSSLR